MMVINYFKRLLSVWTTWVFTAIDAIAFYIGVSYPSYVIPAWGYWAIAGLGFLISNIIIFVRQEEKIRGYEIQEANIVMRVIKSEIRVQAPYLATGQEMTRVNTPRTADGLDDTGIPFKTKLLARVEIENTGHEEGDLIWKLDLENLELPELFMIYQNNVNGNFSDDLKVTPLKVKGRDRFESLWRIGLCLQENDPEAFAKKLSYNLGYGLFLNYTTKRIGGETQPRSLLIEGNLESYKESLIANWKARKLDRLVHLATNAPHFTEIN